MEPMTRAGLAFEYCLLLGHSQGESCQGKKHQRLGCRSKQPVHLSHLLLPPALLALLAPRLVLRRAEMGPLATDRDWEAAMMDAGMGPCWISLLFPQG